MKNITRILLGALIGLLLTAGAVPIFYSKGYNRGYEVGYEECIEDVGNLIRYELYRRGIILPEPGESNPDIRRSEKDTSKTKISV